MKSEIRIGHLSCIFLIRYAFSILLVFLGVFSIGEGSHAASWHDVWSPQQQLKFVKSQYEHDTIAAYQWASNNNIRIWIQPEYFNGPVYRVRIRLKATPAGDINYGGVSICEKAVSGNPWDCATNPVKITFSGQDGIVVPANQERFSDEFAGFTLEASKNYLINYYVTGSAVFWHHGAAETDNPTRYLWWIHEQGNQTMTKTLPSMYTDEGWLTKIYGVEAIQGYTDYQTIRAASASQDDVQTALNKAADGDTVEIPAGSATWPGTVYMSRGNTLKGQGANTVITPLNQAVNMTSDHAGIRLTGITFTGGPTNIVVSVYSWNPSFRIDHNQFINQNYAPIEIGGQGFSWRPFGVVDANLFQGQKCYVRVFSDNYADWDRPDNFGSAELVYIENNQFIGTPNSVVTDSDYGGRFVFRYNDITNATVHAHAMGQGVNPATGSSVRQTEIYNNDFVVDGLHQWGLIYIGGGASLIHHNKIRTINNGDIGGGIVTFRNYRGDAEQPGIAFSCTGVDACYGGSSYDGNTDFASGTASCGTCNNTTLTVGGSPGWTNDKFVGYQLFNTSDPNAIKSHCQITSNTGNTISCSAGLAGGSLTTWSNGNTFAIRSGWPCKQQIGRGQRLSTNPEIYAYDPARIWANDKSGCISGEACSTWVLVYKEGTCLANVLHDAGNGYRLANFGLPDSDDFLYAPDIGGKQDNTYAKTDYTPYTCPHPLTGLTGSCDQNIAGLMGYNVGQDRTAPASPTGLTVN